MTREQDAAIEKLAELQIKLGRVKLAAERIEQIWRRANRRRFRDIHSHESRALAENVRQIVAELGTPGLEPPEPLTNNPGPFWVKGESK